MGYIIAFAVVIIIVVWAVYSQKEKEALGETEVAPSQIEQERSPVTETTNATQTQQRSNVTTAVVVSILIIIVLILGILWGTGYSKGKKSADEGISLFAYAIMLDSMNSVSASGFRYYMEHNTNIQQMINDFLD